jgi:hypothetical protein
MADCFGWDDEDVNDYTWCLVTGGNDCCQICLVGFDIQMGLDMF